MVLALCALTFDLRAYHLGPTWDIHVDELTYLNISQSVMERFQLRLYGEPFYLHPPAYFFLEALVLKVLNPAADVISQVYAARSLNVVLGAFSAGLLYLIGSRVAGWKAGLTAATLFALDPFAVRTNSQTLLETSAVFWALLGWFPLFRAAETRKFGRREIVWAGIAFGLALLTKDMLVFMTLLPLAVCFAFKWTLPRRAAAQVAGVAVLTYLPYPLIVLMVGDGRLFAEAKFSGISRFLGAAKTTGFKRAGGPSLVEALFANLQTFGTTYLLAFGGLLAMVLLWRSGKKLQRLLALFVSCAYALLGFSVLIGTLEEQFFYYMTVPAMLGVSVAFWAWVQRRVSTRRPGSHQLQGSRQLPYSRQLPASQRLLVPAVFGTFTALAFVGWTLFTWTGFHSTPSNGYEVLRAYMRKHVPKGSRISTMTEESVFLTRGYTTGVWSDLAALRGSQVEYVLLSTQQVAKGYGYAPPALKSWLDVHAKLLVSAPSRSYGSLNLYKLPTSVASALPNSDVVRGKAGWLYLPSEYRTDPATLADPASAGAYAAETMARIGRLLKEQGQSMQVMLVPNKSRAYAKYLPGDLKVPEVIDKRYARTLASLHRLGVLAPDLASAFEQVISKPGDQQLYFKQDHHWTPFGAEVAASQAAASIKGTGSLKGMVDLSSLPTVTTKRTEFPGKPSDLRSLSNLLPAAEQKKLKPETFTRLEIKKQTAGAADLLGDSAPGISLVGSSFSAISSLAFAPLLEHNLSHEVLNVSVPAEGPWQPMLSYLRSDAYQKSPPKLVIWEFWEDFLNNQGVGTVPFGFLLDTAANIMNACPAAGSATPAPVLSASGGYHEVSVVGAANPLGDYLHMRVTAPGQTTLNGQFVGGGKPRPFTLPFPGDGQPHDVNVPIYASAGNATERIRIFTGDQSTRSVSGTRLCHLPAYVTEPAYLSLGHLDLLESSAPPGTQLSGLAEIETTGHRWGTGKQTSVAFFSPADRTLNLRIKFRSPVTGQGMRITMNDAELLKRSNILKDDVTDLSLSLKVRAGLNTLALIPALQNTGKTRFAPQDPRPTTVEYTKFLLDDQ
jgi:SGNH hydrolase-like domain, acetyltransferase AlgX/Dolichyl-phosphate-mannose-protein mannosyltransferase